MTFRYILTILSICLLLGKANAQVSDQTIWYDNVTRSDNCVLISGHSFKGNFFVNSCRDRWTLKQFPSIGTVFDLDFADSTSGWMIISGSIVRVENNRLISADRELGEIRNSGFLKILKVRNGRIIAIGINGRLVSSNDDGISWREEDLDEKFDLSEAVFRTPGEGWLIGRMYQSGLLTSLALYRTEDGGKKWNQIPQAEEGSFEQLFFLSSDFGWSIGRNGNIYRTADGGKSWSKVDGSKHEFKNLFFVDDKTGWAFTDTQLFKSVDSGLTWQKQFKLDDAYDDFQRVIFVNREDGWVCSRHSVFLTKDAGATWHKLDISSALSEQPDSPSLAASVIR